MIDWTLAPVRTWSEQVSPCQGRGGRADRERCKRNGHREQSTPPPLTRRPISARRWVRQVPSVRRNRFRHVTVGTWFEGPVKLATPRLNPR